MARSLRDLVVQLLSHGAFQKLAALGVAAILGLGSVPASANSVDGTVPAANEWGHVFFTHGGGALSIDILARDWTGGPTGSGVDDSFIKLFVDDGSPIGALTGSFVSENDDSSGFADGSTSTLDSLLEFADLPAGNYVLTIGHCCSFGDETGARSNSSSGIHTDDDGPLFGDFRVTFTPDLATDLVPLPGTLALLGAGLLGVAWRRRPLR